ncbi:MAG TPA: cytochrome c biogenesis protein CcsA, partial [Candidatus Dormibacteraeota bacterium]|nr:cytochrome c biogenesis protein CcsA [Candidatus Dormibacteraeota bacterium]
MIWAELGGALLMAGLVLALSATGFGWAGGRRSDPILAWVAHRFFLAATAAVIAASACLVVALASSDFWLAYVVEHTDAATPLPLKIAAFYGGQEGSLLYWTLVLACLGAISLASARRGPQPLQAYATAVLGVLLSFFLLLLVFVTSPFVLLYVAAPDGLGLNPLLRDGGMLIHPPFLLAGMASFAIPFSFAMAALMSGQTGPTWIALTRRVALLAWGLQSAGLVLGMWWAYHVLGWGGYWGWDPVENVALLPWLATTAYIHSAQVEEKRGGLALWNFSLVILAFCL